MKILKRLLKIVFALIGALILIGVFTLWVDSARSDYLNIDKREKTSVNSYIISNVNVIPMNIDTVLMYANL